MDARNKKCSRIDVERAHRVLQPTPVGLRTRPISAPVLFEKRSRAEMLLASAWEQRTGDVSSCNVAALTAPRASTSWSRVSCSLTIPR